ncbi:hypothetical protein GCM10017044_16840 [Kordiimonas sediminis]|uniref:Lipoprotein n=1 Tax=Kordiimonas sediminis TaxID=1735581 RepID=A0A919E8C9_9PROT|nr:hypothetical protein [Kordiimonas sediminis]GHF23059.1 hypothetical protein GCM10017044_16840 [Kordiimonas sediminis]
MNKILALSLLLGLAACGDKADEIIFDTRLGPETKSQIAPLPSGLVGDKDNARHMSQEKKGKNLESTDGTGTA